MIVAFVVMFVMIVSDGLMKGLLRLEEKLPAMAGDRAGRMGTVVVV